MENKPKRTAGSVLLTIFGWFLLVIGLLVTATGIGFLQEEGAENRGLAAFSLVLFGCMAVGGLLIILRRRVFGKKKTAAKPEEGVAAPAPARNNAAAKKVILITVLIFAAVAIPTCIIAVGKEIQNRFDHPPAMVLTETQEHAAKGFLKEEELERLELSAEPDGKVPGEPEPWFLVRLKGYESKGTEDTKLLRAVGWSQAYRWQTVEYRETELTSEEWEKVNTLVLARYGQWTAHYGAKLGVGTGSNVGIGTSEYVDLYYFDAKTGEQYAYERYGKKLPETVTKVPHYVVTDEELAGRVQQTIESKAPEGKGT